MSFLDSLGSIFSNEKSHIGNLLSSWGNSPGKTLAQFALGAQDPLGAKIWNGALGTHFTPSVGQFGGETDAQFSQSRKQGVDTGNSQTLGQIANVVAAVWGGAAAGGALGGALGGSGGGAAAGSGAGAGEGAAGSSALGIGAGTETTSAAAETSLGSGAAFDAAGAGTAGGAGAGGAGASTNSGFGGAGTDAAASGPGAGTGTGTGSAWLHGAESAAKVLAPTVLSSVLSPKPPKTKAPTAMPDPLAQQQAIQQKLIAQMARRGRASTILTNPASGASLGG